MDMDVDSCYSALRARDTRFDGVFYVGVATTGVYCRPICPARLPARDRCTFFASAAAAEHAGYRACFRCRPELAPGLSPIEANSRLARSAAARIEAGYLNDHSIETLSAELHVTSRHLRRTLESELGISPVSLAKTVRLALAKQLLHDTTMPLADVAFAAGFASVRRFNALFRERFGRPPSAVRRDHGTGEPAGFISLRLDYRPPFAWEPLLRFLRDRATPGVESIDTREYRRIVAVDGRVGWVAVGTEAGRHALRARVSPSLAPKLMDVVARLRALFDLDARPALIADHLRNDVMLRPLVDAVPGLRVPGAFDGFEMAIRAVLGQQVSVQAATTLCGRVVRRFGRDATGQLEGLTRIFPSAEALAAASPAQVRQIGIPARRAHCIVELARAVVERRLDLSRGTDPAETIRLLQDLPGVGSWTAQYIVMRALKWPDAFPATDLALQKALGTTSAREAERQGRAWQPWRAYATLHLWNALTQGD